MTAERLNGAHFTSSKSSFVQFSMEDQEHHHKQNRIITKSTKKP